MTVMDWLQFRGIGWQAGMSYHPPAHVHAHQVDGRGKVEPTDLHRHGPEGRKQEQQQRRGQGHVGLACTEDYPMHHDVEVACC